MNYKKMIGSISTLAVLSPSVVVEAEAYQPIMHLDVTVGDKPVKSYEESRVLKEIEARYMYIDREKVDRVAVYEGPSSSSKRVGYAYSDYARYVTNIINGYAEVTYGGNIGYIKYDLLRNNRITEIKYIKNNVEVKEKSSGTKVVGKLSEGEQVTVLGYYKDTMARVKLGDIIGYISVKDLTNVKPRYMYIDRNKVDKVAVYESPSSSSKRVGYAYSDYARYVTDVIDGYAEITYDGKTGYVKYDLLRKDRITETKYIKNNVEVKEKSSGTKVVGKLSEGEQVTVLGYYKDTMARVKLGDIIGYISVKDLTNVKPRYMYIDRNKVDKVAVYESPSSSSKRVGYAYSDYARYVTDVIDGYAEITYGGNTGYVKYDLLRKDRITETMYLKETVHPTEKSSNSVIVGTLNIGQEVTVLGYYKDTLARVKSGDITGYIEKTALSKDKLMYLDSITSGNTTVNTRYAIKDKAPVYSDTGLSECIGFLANGDRIEFIEKVNSIVSKFKVNNKLIAYMNTVDISHKNPLAKNTTSTTTKKLAITHGEYVDTQVGKPYTTIEDVKYYSNPKSYSINNNDEKYQFLKLDTFRNINVYELNEYLNSLPVQNGKEAIFKNQAQAFVGAARKNNIDPIYLVAHTMLETGYGSSMLAQGVTVTQDPAGNSVKPTKVHNLFGIGAVDADAVGQGSKVAYALGWTDIPKAIDGAAKWIATGVSANPSIGLKESQGYIHSQKFTEQYNLYSMRWDYVYGWHQYASDPQWALKISRLMNKLSYLYEGAKLVFENIEYKVAPYVELLDISECKEVLIKSKLKSGPSERYRDVGEIEKGSIVVVKGYVDGYAWIECNGQDYYILESALGEVKEEMLINDLKVEESIEDDNIYTKEEQVKEVVEEETLEESTEENEDLDNVGLEESNEK